MTDIAIEPLRSAPPSTSRLAEEEVGRFAPVYALPRLELVSGNGAVVTDAAGREYLDFVAGIAVHALGHSPAGLTRAIGRQLKRLTHCSNLFANRPAIELAEALLEATGYDRVFFCNSGTEGIEAALKFARVRARAGNRPGTEVVAFKGGFHGRTAFSLSVTWQPSYREPFEPLMPGVRFAEYNDLEALDAVLDERVAAVVVEPVQGESGAIPARPEFLKGLRARCDSLGASLIFDEVQCGMGRCGRLLAAEHYGVRADITVLSKALGGGLPLAAVLMTAAAAGALAPGQHGCTFGGGPVTATAASYVLARVRRPGFLAGVRSRGRALEKGLDALVSRHPSLAGHRGLGLLQAIVIRDDAPYTPAALVTAARDHGLLLVRGGERAVRLLPPLTVKTSQIDEALRRIEAALEQCEGSNPQGGETR